MSAVYAYFVVDQRNYEIEPPLPLGQTAAGVVEDPYAALSERLHAALTTLFAQPGYRPGLGRPTPDRVLHVRALIQNGMLSPADADRWFDDRVSDSAWEVLCGVDPGAGPFQATPVASAIIARQRRPPIGPRSVASWSMGLRAGSASREFALDPDAHPGGRLPLDLIADALSELAVEGWSVVHLSEDRRVDDAASASFVVAQRYLLTRAG